MPKQSKQNTSANNQEFAGTKYHKEHASNVPDYGNNDTDPNAKNTANQKENR